MKFLYAKFVGYIGFYNGLGITKLEIDFTKSKYGITVISGPNGTGKTTLLNALTVMPDNNNNFVPSMEASKTLRIFDSGNIYDIFIVHPIDGNNNRSTTKATISKNGLELNPNGNISSYKEVIFSEFDLDSNFLALSKLSGDDRGIADKRPAERKKFVVAITNSLEVYNEIHKNLNKKANIFKSYVNNLSSKIQNIGDESYLRTTFLSLQNREKKIDQIIDECKEKIIESRTLLSVDDPEGSMQQRYETVDSDLNREKLNLDKLYSSLKSKFDNLRVDGLNLTSQSFELVSLNTSKLLDSCTTKVNISKTKCIALLDQIQSIQSDINRYNIKIDKLKSEINSDLTFNLQETNRKLDEIISIYSKFGIGDISTSSAEEVKFMISIINTIISSIDAIYDNIDNNIDFFYAYEKGKLSGANTSIGNAIIEKKEIKETIVDSINNLNIQRNNIQNELEIAEDILKKPKNCKEESCPFLENANEIIKKYGSINDMKHNFNIISEKIEQSRQDISVINSDIDKLEQIHCIDSIFDSIYNTINSNIGLLSKLKATSDIIDIDNFLELLHNDSRFNSMRNINGFLDASNYITEFKSLNIIKQKLESEYMVQKNNIDSINEFESERDQKEKELEDIKKQYNYHKNECDFNTELMNTLNRKKTNIDILKYDFDNWMVSNDNYERLLAEFNDLKNKFQSSISTLGKISDLNLVISENTNQKEPIKQQLRSIESQLSLLDTYKQEYEMYSEKYTIINKLKKYSSPTDGGIQTLFINIYMSETLELANQLLSMIFAGQYKLMKYIINNDEFRMPFIGNGLPVDDISSGSTSQVCIMGMIINLVLRHQASTKYNITSLDEIDGGLDHNNRNLFVDILQRVQSILNIDQLFIISHSVESALCNVDVIQLSNAPDYNDLFMNANVIYKFGEEN